jgi:hypothetical protein
MLTNDMPAGKTFYATLGGVRNPRFIALNS